MSQLDNFRPSFLTGHCILTTVQHNNAKSSKKPQSLVGQLKTSREAEYPVMSHYMFCNLSLRATSPHVSRSLPEHQTLSPEGSTSFLSAFHCIPTLSFSAQVKKTNKWVCKVCNAKQSVIKVYGKGNAADCRKHVQTLNMMRGEEERRK